MIRLINDGWNSPEFNMAADEALLILVSHNLIPPTLRLWNFAPTTVALGRFSQIDGCVNTEGLTESNLAIIRRFTGGGVTLNEEQGDINWSYAVRGNDVYEKYKEASVAIVGALKYLGLDGKFRSINDIVVDGKKVVGMAGAKSRGGIIVHGTFLFDADTKLFDRFLKLPKKAVKETEMPSHGVSTISELLNRKVSRMEAIEAITYGFSLLDNLDLGSWKEIELDLINALKYKFSNKDWTYGISKFGKRF